MTKATAFLASVPVGMALGLCSISIEITTMAITFIASAIIIVVGFAVYCKRDIRLKIAITPLFVSAVTYYVFSVFLEPIETVDYLCQSLDSIGIIAITIYSLMNRRGNHVGKETTEKTHQEKAYTAQEMSAFSFFK